jgi:DtxR family Mn-dependent transcriptional regulator
MNPALNLLVATIVAGLLFLTFRRHGWFARWRHRTRRRTTRVHIEDALKHLFTFAELGQVGSLESLAGAVEVTRDEAARLAARLEQKGLVRPHRAGWELTDEGRRYALQIIRTHRLWERYLADETGIDEGEWHERADQIEHKMSPDEVEALSERMGHPAYDPHGDPIPSAEGSMGAPLGVPLNTVPSGSAVRVVHVEDEPDSVYRLLCRANLQPGMTLRVIESTAEQVGLDAGVFQCVLPPVAAANVSVQELDESEASELARYRLSSLNVGQTAEVVDLSPACRGLERRRLLDLGLVPGTTVTAELQSMGNDPTAYRIRGALIALRRQQADLILIKPDGGGPANSADEDEGTKTRRTSRH